MFTPCSRTVEKHTLNSSAESILIERTTRFLFRGPLSPSGPETVVCAHSEVEETSGATGAESRKLKDVNFAPHLIRA